MCPGHTSVQEQFSKISPRAYQVNVELGDVGIVISIVMMLRVDRGYRINARSCSRAAIVPSRTGTRTRRAATADAACGIREPHGFGVPIQEKLAAGAPK
jgi:hypothetical protein